MADCSAAEAVPERIPFPSLQWQEIAAGRAEGSLVDAPFLEWKKSSEGVLSTELGPDGHHAMLQVLHLALCGESTFYLKRLIDLTTGETVGVYRMSGRCSSGTFTRESATTAGVYGHDDSRTNSYELLGSRRVGEDRWTWWSRPGLVGLNKIHDLADGTLVFRTPSSLRVALDRGSNTVVQVDDSSIAGSAADDIFVWSKWLEPAGSALRSWSRSNGLENMSDLPGVACQVAADSAYVVGLFGVGDCLSYLSDVRFWRMPRREPLTGPRPLLEGPAIPAKSRFGLRYLRVADEHAAVFAYQEDPEELFLLVARFSDESLWRVDAREGLTLWAFTLSPDHLYLLETDRSKPVAYMTAVQRLSLDALELYAKRL